MIANLVTIMKIKSLVFACATVLLTAEAKADHFSPVNAQACELTRLSDAMLCSYESSARECHMNGRQRAFLASLRCMKTMSNRLHDQLDDGAEACVLNRSIADLNHGYGITVSQANDLSLPASTRGLLCSYGNVFRQVKGSVACALAHQNERSYRREDSYRREPVPSYDHRRAEPVSDREIIIGALSRILGDR